MLVQLAEVKGQLQSLTLLITQNHEATHQRINDFRHAVEGRISGVEGRVVTLEKNERSTALKASASGAISGFALTATVEAIKHILR